MTAPRTRLEREFDTDAVRAIPGVISIGGVHLAAEAIRVGRIDEFRMLVSPIIVGGGTPYLPLGVTVPLALGKHRRFGNGMVFLRYRCA